MNKLQMAEQFRKALQMFAASLDDEKAMEVATVFDAWKPDTGYEKGAKFTYGINGVGDPQLYKVNQTHKSSSLYLPGAVGTEALYTAIGLDAEGYPIWSQPTGAHDAYNKGDIVDYGATLYISMIDGNTTVPGTDERYWTVYVA